MAYNITDNVLLVGEFSNGELEAQQRVAEVLLGFTNVAEYTDLAKKQQAEDAIATQVSYQREMGIEAFVLAEETRGLRRKKYRGSRRMPPIHPIARRLASNLINSATAATVR